MMQHITTPSRCYVKEQRVFARKGQTAGYLTAMYRLQWLSVGGTYKRMIAIMNLKELVKRKYSGMY
jgi:hypothetical protein